MSIVALRKLTLVGHVDDKPRVLADLQEIGCLHLIPIAPLDGAPRGTGPSSESRDALRFLLTSPQRRRQVTQPDRFDAVAVEAETLALSTRLKDLEDERDFLVKRIADLEPWGDFEIGSLEGIDGLRLWFYLVPHYMLDQVAATGRMFAVVNRDNRFCYVVVISQDEPDDMPVRRTHTGAIPRHELEERLEEVEIAIEDAIAERVSLSRWCTLLAASLDRLEDRAARSQAAAMTLDAAPLFAVQGWIPLARTEELERYAAEHRMVSTIEEPGPEDRPPTHLDNSPAIAGGEGLVTFYMTPGYWTWDPSGVVLYSFALFFAMILADAGYAAVLALVLRAYWHRMGESDAGRRFRSMFTTIVVFSLAYGVIAGSYFGVEPGEDSPLRALKLIDVTDAETMMAASIAIGTFHVTLAALMDAMRRGPRLDALPSLGWASTVSGGFVTAAGVHLEAHTAQSVGTVMMVFGLGLVFLFSGSGGLLARVGGGLLALFRVTNAFGDVMSYLRLFALGLASASLAAAFNDMAGEIRENVRGLGLLAAGLVLLIGHGMNFVLSLMSATVHGLRLNVIEFFNWGLKDEGKPFRPYKRKETVPWNRSS